MKKYLYLFLILSIAFVFYGCGKTGGLSSMTSLPAGLGSGSGTLKVNFTWPGGGKFIPADTHRIYLRIYGDSLSEEITRTYERPSSGNTSDTISGINTGSVNVEVSAKDSSGNTLAHRLSSLVIKEGDNDTLNLTLGVTISNTGFTPGTIYIPVNTTLMWFNNSSLTSALIGNLPFDGADIRNGGSKSYTFTEVGTYNYSDLYNNSSTGTVVVYEGPVIYSVSPSSGAAGDSITITGKGFGTTQGSSIVTFVTTHATQIVSWSDTKIVCYVPEGATSGNIGVTVNNIISNPVSFTVTGVSYGWSEVQSGKNYDLKALDFYGSNYAWAVGTIAGGSPTGVVLSFDGSTWSLKADATGGTYDYYDVKTLGYTNASQNDIYAAGDNGVDGVIRHFKNGSWQQDATIGGTGNSIRGIDFATISGTRYGFAVGLLNKIFRLDSGIWSTSSFSYQTQDDYFGVAFQGDSGNATATGIMLYKVPAPTGSWQKAGGTSLNIQWNDVFFFDANYGWAVGNNGRVVYTVDGGANWTLTSVETGGGVLQDLNAVYFTSKDLGWAVGTLGVIYKSENGGSSWTKEENSLVSNLHDVHFISASKGFAVGNNGVILKYGAR